MKMGLAKYFKQALLTLVLLGFSNVLFVPKAHAASCPTVAEILFKDTVYGLATGVVVSGLVLLASEDDDSIPAKLATGAIIGAAAGAVVGGVEIAISPCYRNSSQRRDHNNQRPGNGTSFPSDSTTDTDELALVLPQEIPQRLSFTPVMSVTNADHPTKNLGMGLRAELSL